MKLFVAIMIAASAAACAVSAEPAKQLFGAQATPTLTSAHAPLGSYAKGCLAGGVRLPETGPSWQAMRLERNRNWGHPALIAFITRLGAAADSLGWEGILVGDLSQPRGGPMTSGHQSHQIGLDADIWMRPGYARELSRAERSKISSFSVVGADRRSVNEHWTPAHARLLRAAAEDDAVARIFVNAAIKAALCRDEAADNRLWLRKIRPWWGHAAHFHVRLSCPPDAGECEDQAPPPPGDGCGDTLAWWFSDEALNPKPAPKSTPKPALTLADLPPACAGVLAAE
ncbi:penicillin-insensitive murein endopeptidase [Pikeienuella sp. HZG-20]|uniref:penicillin-insensitive murein endopeptidase n=1 Tax=Paludibacillus litoralis TaxID=3133267 RepID=UPI0030EC44B4